MLLFERFRAFNAYPFKEIDLNLRNQGLVRMVGPNGAGKSSAWHLFTQCAQGSSPNMAKKSDIMISDKDFLLEISFRRNDAAYVAAQAIKCSHKSPVGQPYGTGAYLFRDGVDISMHKDPDTLKLIKSTLGWSIEEWYGYVYLAQATTHTLINGTRSDRQNYLSALFNLQPLDVLAGYFRKKAEDLSTEGEKIELAKQELSIKNQMYSHDEHVASKKAYTEFEARLIGLDAELKELAGQQQRYQMRQALEEKLSRLTPPTESAESLQAKYDEVVAHQEKANANQMLFANLQARLNGLATVAEPSLPEGWKDEYEDSPDLDEKREQAELSRLTQLENNFVPVASVQVPQDLTTVLGSPDINLIQVKRQIEQIESRPAPPTFPKPTLEQLNQLRDTKSELSYKILNLKTEVQRLQFNEQVCDKCGSALNCGDREAQLAERNEQLSEATDEMEVATSKIVAKEKQSAVWSGYEALGPDRSGELPELKASVALYETKLAYLKIKAAHEAFELSEKVREELKALPEIRERLRIWKMKQAVRLVAEQKAKRDAYLKEKLVIEQQMAGVETLANRSNESRLFVVQIDEMKKYRAAEQELVPYLDAKDMAAEQVNLQARRDGSLTGLGKLKVSLARDADLQAAIAKLQAAIASQDKVVRDQKRHALLAKGYGKAGMLRERQLAKFSRYLEEALLAHTIKQLPDHRFEIKVDDGIDILAVYVGKSKPAADPYDIKFMSGGEKGALSVAFLFALDDLLPPSRRTNLKIIDEVEAGFDVERQQDFIAYTLPELRNRAETVVVISHSHAANAGSFDRIWEIKNGIVKDSTQDARAFG